MWAGTWQCNVQAPMPVQATLTIGYPQREVLYPAMLKLQCGTFTGTYQMLLVKKSTRELAISKNKLAQAEHPFSFGANTQWLNGWLDYGRNKTGLPVLSVRNLYRPTKTDTAKAPGVWPEYEALLYFFKTADLFFERSSGVPLAEEAVYPILTPSVAPVYFGLSDTIYVPTKDAALHFTTLKKAAQVSVTLHGKTILDRLPLSRKTSTEDLLLDTGLNLLVLFNENTGADGVSKSRMVIETGTKKTTVDFGNPGDSGASFIVTQLFFEREKAKETFFEDNTNDNIPLQPNEKKLGSVITYSASLTLAVWDDAQFDGDSITILVNNKIVRTGFLVKKQPQYIVIPLQKGANTITFLADNVGSIPPNTAVLEIMDGLRRRSFMLETVPGEKSGINILYNNSF
jgi:hypothetical protein